MTGSSNPYSNVKIDSAAGCISRITMRTMSLYESKDSSGEILLSSLFENNFVLEKPLKINKTIKDYAFLIKRGGWPKCIELTNERDISEYLLSYLNAVVNFDIKEISKVSKNSNKLLGILYSYSRNIATNASLSTIMNDTINNGINISKNTFSLYLDLLRRTYIVDEIPAWTMRIRSKIRLVSMNKKI